MIRTHREGEASAHALRGLADEELMELVAKSEAAAFEVVLERHADAAFALAYRMVGRSAPAEDILQEALLSLWRSGARYERTHGSVRAWILGIVHNQAIDTLRRDGVRESRNVSDEGLEDWLVAPERTEVEAAQRAETSEVRGALERLPAEQRRVIELAYFGGFTHGEIAAMLELPMGTVKGRMRLGLDKLRDCLQAEERSL